MKRHLVSKPGAALRAELLVALVAPVLGRMLEPPVHHQLGPAQELARTVRAAVRVLPAPVAPHRARVHEPLAAVLAPVRILAGVAHLVQLQLQLAPEPLAARVARVRFAQHVLRLVVALHRLPAGELHRTVRMAAVDLGPGGTGTLQMAGPHVPQQMGPVRVGFAAVRLQAGVGVLQTKTETCVCVCGLPPSHFPFQCHLPLRCACSGADRARRVA